MTSSANALSRYLDLYKRVFTEAVVAGRDTADVGWEQPTRTLQVLVVLLKNAADQAHRDALRETPELVHAMEQLQESAYSLAQITGRTPARTEEAIRKAAAAATDLLHGVQEQDSSALAEGMAEGAESAADAGAAAAAAPANALEAAIHGVQAGLKALDPVNRAKELAKKLGEGARTARNMALIMAATPEKAVKAFQSGNTAAQRMDELYRTLVAGAKTLPGGPWVHKPVIAVMSMTPPMTAASGSSVGAAYGFACILVREVITFWASCISISSLVLAWRFGSRLDKALTELEGEEERQLREMAHAQQQRLREREAMELVGDVQLVQRAQKVQSKDMTEGAERASSGQVAKSSFTSVAVMTPVGPLLPLLAVGLPQTEYCIASHLSTQLPVKSAQQDAAGEASAADIATASLTPFHDSSAAPQEQQSTAGTGRHSRAKVAWVCLLVAFLAVRDTLIVPWRILQSRAPDERWSVTLHRLMTLLVQPVLVLVGALLAVGDTVVHIAKNAGSSPQASSLQWPLTHALSLPERLSTVASLPRISSSTASLTAQLSSAAALSSAASLPGRLPSSVSAS